MTNSLFAFEDPALVVLLEAELDSWRGTPFHFDSRAKGPGGGIDCVGFCECVMCAVGVTPAFMFPRTPADNSLHVHNDKILRYLRGEAAEDPQSALLARIFAELPPPIKKPVGAFGCELEPALLPGDLLIMRAAGRGLWHMPIMRNARSFMQCAFPDGVSEADVTQSDYHKRIEAVFRARALEVYS